MSEIQTHHQLRDYDEVNEIRRPALRKLTIDAEDLSQRLREGFHNRRRLIEWAQETIPKLLGEIPTWFYNRLAIQLQAPLSDDLEMRVALAALLDKPATANISDHAAEEIRRGLAVNVLEPAFIRGLRALRRDAGSYVGESRSQNYDHRQPDKQSYPAMRPSLQELHEFQQEALAGVLDGLEDRDAIVRWGNWVINATNGEPVLEESLRESLVHGSTFVQVCVNDDVVREILTDDDPGPRERRMRQIYATKYLLPAFNRGVQHLRGKANEEPSQTTNVSAPGDYE